jgi:hypothetical protein
MTRSALFFLACMVWCRAFAQQTPDDVTDSQIHSYQVSLDADCRAEGARKGTPVERINARCSCIAKTLKDEVSYYEWQQAYFHWIRAEHGQQQAVIAPHMRNADVICGVPH